MTETLPPLFYFALGYFVGAACVVLVWQAYTDFGRS